MKNGPRFSRHSGIYRSDVVRTLKSRGGRCTVDLEMPLAAAAPRTVQCVAAFGLRDSVRRRRTAIFSSSIDRGRPLLSSSYSPATRLSMKRFRHLPTVAFVHCTRSAISVLLLPAADHNTTLARATMPCGKARERARLANCSRSSSFKINSVFGRPVAML
jgi:hypothetical protein